MNHDLYRKLSSGATHTLYEAAADNGQLIKDAAEEIMRLDFELQVAKADAAAYKGGMEYWRKRYDNLKGSRSVTMFLLWVGSIMMAVPYLVQLL